MSEADVTAIRKLYESNVAALNAGDLPALLRLYAEDAILMRPNATSLVGKDAIRVQLETELGAFRVRASVGVVEVEVAGPWAWAGGAYTMTAIPRTRGESMEERGKWLDILRRQPDGRWTILRATWSSDRPPT